MAAATSRDTAEFEEAWLEPRVELVRAMQGDSARKDRRSTWAEERRINAETFGLPLRSNRGRGGFRGRGNGMGFRGGRGRGERRGAPGGYGAPRGFRGGYRGSRGGREFADYEYRKDNKVAA